MAGASRQDLLVEGPVDPEYLTVLRLRYVPLLRIMFEFRETAIDSVVSTAGGHAAPTRVRAEGQPPGPAALLFSGGIDSFYSLTQLRRVGFPLRLLVNVHAGAHCHRACMERRKEQVRRVADASGLGFIAIDTNFHDVIDVGHLVAHPFRTVAAAYTLHGAVDGVFLSTGLAYHDLSFDWINEGGEAAGGSMTDSVAWARMPVTEIGYERRRFEKLEIVADEPLSYQALDVCLNGQHPGGGEPGAPPNCTECRKCIRTMLSLELMGRLDRYRTQFDLEAFAAKREELLGRVRQSRLASDRDLLARLRGSSLPGFGTMPIGIPAWASGPSWAAQPEDVGARRQARQKPPIRLYWWPGEPRLPNVGDELSPLIVERISGRKVLWASPEACDLAAIGSIMDVVLSADRRTPVHIWGTGFISDGPTLAHAPVHVAAIRGPFSAARLGLDGDIPLGDPGLFAGLLVEGPVRKVRNVGVIPHHLELDLSVYQAWRSLPGSLISPHLTPREFIESIAGCDLVFSASLHGLIVADAMGVPSIWVRPSGRVTGHGFKFRDYLRSVGRAEEPRELPTPDDLRRHLVDDLVNAYAFVGLADIRQRLAVAFPDV